ncbi:ATPase family AAA domain-containing protein 5 [Phytophthora ramorum]|uniref:ATPase family AAA domain-containing protein 5 n=1 Tax=Phytophthora ramorum TaxID=164328 RepID=UPI0030AAE5D9|nr:ATPase family AAA domain-containing protein 5 [Phytophthora ramorum]
MASQGMSSWLSVPKSEVSDTLDTSESQPQDKSEDRSDSPLDISLAQLRAKETITRISPDKRSLVEEIDSEADDAEFDERAHWARRGARKKARASRRAARAVDKSQPSIALFCVKGVEKPEAVEEENALTSAIMASQSEKIAAEKKSKARKKKASAGLEMASAVDSSLKQDDLSTVMSSGRPKRHAVMKTEILQQQQKLLDAVAARNNAASFLTPPPSTKKTEANVTTSGRKRKLEMNKKKTSPPAKAVSTTNSPGGNKTAQSFFLSEQERKQLQEIEAVSTFREQLRQTREKDLAFFAGQTASPFFQARAGAKRSSSAENDDGIVEIHEDGEPKPRRGTGTGRWSRSLSLFPNVQHVLSMCVEAEDMDTSTNGSMPSMKAVPNVDIATAVVVIDDDSTGDSRLPSDVMGQLKAAMNGQVVTESSFSEQFWFREFLDASSIPAPVVEAIDVTSPRPVVNSDATAVELAQRETLLIDELVETHGMREKRVRELLEGLEQAKAKRVDREQNLSLVDRYLPVNASGLVGNRDSLHTLSSWLSAWKVGVGDRERLDCFSTELFTFEDGDSDSEDEVGDLCRLFILEGESGSGKSAAVYACAEELGYEIIEINAAQSRSGKSVVELAGEATQSTRVLHVGGKDDKSRKKQKQKKKRRRHSEGRKSLEKSTAASLSLVLFEDVDLVFDEDKGFLNAVCSIAKHSKCPIVVTCAQLPDAFPTKPGRLRRELRRPSMDEFATWLHLVAFIEGLQLVPSLIDALGKYFECDVRRSLNFLEANLSASEVNTKAQWRWQHVSADKRDADESGHVDIPAWTVWSTGCSSFDALTSNLLAELSAVEQNIEDKTREEKQADIDAMADLAQILDAASVAETWMAPATASSSGRLAHGDAEQDSFFLSECERLAALELRRSSLHMLVSSTNPLGALLMRGQGPSASACVQRTFDSALAASRRRAHQTALAELKSKFELPPAYKGCGNSEPQFVLDYMPMVGRLLSSTGLQEGRRRTSRRNHYLGDVLGDMTLIDDLPAFNTYIQTDEDQIIAASPASTQ